MSNTIVSAGLLLCVIAGATGPPPARAEERQLLFINDTRQSIVEIYVSDPGSGNWREDALGADFLPPGDSVTVRIDVRADRCRFDVKTVLDDGTALIRRGVDACRVERYLLSHR